VDTGNQSVSALAHRLEQKLAQHASSVRPAHVEAPASEAKTCAP
jgi:hypothetical protein